MKIQVTLFDKTKTYKPLSTIIEIETGEQTFEEYYKHHKQQVLSRGVQGVCHFHHTDWRTLQQQGFTVAKCREFDQEKIEQRKRTNKIKALYEKRQQEKKDAED